MCQNSQKLWQTMKSIIYAQFITKLKDNTGHNIGTCTNCVHTCLCHCLLSAYIFIVVHHSKLASSYHSLGGKVAPLGTVLEPSPIEDLQISYTCTIKDHIQVVSIYNSISIYNQYCEPLIAAAKLSAFSHNHWGDHEHKTCDQPSTKLTTMTIAHISLNYHYKGPITWLSTADKSINS